MNNSLGLSDLRGYSFLQVFDSAGIRFCRYSILQVFDSAGIRAVRRSILQVFSSAGIRFRRYSPLKALILKAVQLKV